MNDILRTYIDSTSLFDKKTREQAKNQLAWFANDFALTPKELCSHLSKTTNKTWSVENFQHGQKCGVKFSCGKEKYYVELSEKPISEEEIAGSNMNWLLFQNPPKVFKNAILNGMNEKKNAKDSKAFNVKILKTLDKNFEHEKS
jgi:hypothetical protein